MVEAAITFGSLPRRKPSAAPAAPAPVAVAPAYDLGDYGDPAFLDSLAIKQLEQELLAQIAHVKHLTAAGHGDPLLGQEKAKGSALLAAWTRRGKTAEDLRGRPLEFKGIN